MRRASRIDDNHAAVCNALLRFPGVSVFSIATVGRGAPDILIGVRGRTYLAEIKDGTKAPSRAQLNEAQRHFQSRWHGSPVVVLRSVGEAEFWIQQQLGGG